MSTTRHAAYVGVLVMALAAVQCSSPTTPGNGTPGVAGVTLDASSVGAGTSGQGAVRLTAMAPTGGASVALASSNPAVATVASSVMIAAGTSSVAFAIVGVSTGTTVITASLNGSSSPSPTLNVIVGPVALASISLSAPNVVGGTAVTGTVMLTAAAPPNGAVVTLTGSDPLTVPQSVTVPFGSSAAVFGVSTRVVSTTTDGTINGAYGGGRASAVLSVTKPTVATASFGVTGPTESDTCTMTNGGNTLNCTFNGSTSTAPGNIVAWDWSYGVAGIFSQTTPGPRLTMPNVDCSMLPAPPLPDGVPWFEMKITLKIHDDQGNVSAVAIEDSARLLPQGVCGF